MKKLFFFFLSVLAITYSLAQKSWTPDQLMKIKNISSSHVSSDGKKVAYALREAIMTDDRSEYVNQIWICNADGSNHVQITKGDKNNANPKWSPDNQSIAFTSSRDGKSNLYVISINGGEAEKLTDAKGGVGDFSWASDGNKIAYTTMDVASDKEEKNKKAKDDWYFLDANPKQNRLAIVWTKHKDSTGKYIQKTITQEDVSVNTFDWSNDNKSIAYSYGKTTKANDMSNCDIAVVDINSGEVKKIATTAANESDPNISPVFKMGSISCI